MKRDDVRAPEQRVESHRRDRRLCIEDIVRTDVVSENRRAERARDARDLLADVAAANDADGRGGDLPAAAMLPTAGREILSERHDASAERDHEADRELGDRLTVDAWRPPNNHPKPPRRVEIDHVEADAVLADDAQAGQRTEYRFVEDVQTG